MTPFALQGRLVAAAAGRATLTLLRSDKTVQKALGIAVAAALLPALLGGREAVRQPLPARLAPPQPPTLNRAPEPADTPLPDVSSFVPGVRVRVLAQGRKGQLGEEIGIFVLTRPMVAVGAQRLFGVAYDGPSMLRIEGAISAEIGGRYQLGLALDPKRRGTSCQVALRVGRHTILQSQEYLAEAQTVVGGIELAAGTWPVSADIACDQVDAKTPVMASLMLRRPTDMALGPADLVYRAVAGDVPLAPIGETTPAASPIPRAPLQPQRPLVAGSAPALPQLGSVAADPPAPPAVVPIAPHRPLPDKPEP
jgi:hypothetical protein